MDFIKTISIRLDEETDMQLSELQKGFQKKYHVRISKSELIRLLLKERYENVLATGGTRKKLL